jgi:hypothetical protein
VIRNDLNFAEFGARPNVFLLNHPSLVKLNAQEATDHKNKDVWRMTNCQKLLDLLDCGLTTEDM